MWTDFTNKAILYSHNLLHYYNKPNKDKATSKHGLYGSAIFVKSTTLLSMVSEV